MSLRPVRLHCEDRQAPLGIDTPAPQVSWVLEDFEHAAGAIQSAYQIQFAAGDRLLHDTGKVVSRQTRQTYTGPSLTTAQCVDWRVRIWDGVDRESGWSESRFTVGVIDSNDWRADWISYDPATYTSPQLPIFRREIILESKPLRAVLFICGLGQHEAIINGQKVGDDRLEPGWTNYSKAALYCTHDCTALFKAGANQIDVMLGNGMYRVIGGRYTKFRNSFGPLKLIAQLHLFDSRGLERVIGTDAHWQVAPGPITFSCAYGGEDYDASLAEPLPEMWKPAILSRQPGWNLVSQQNPPVRISKSFKPVSINTLDDGSRVYDFGQNLSGVPSVIVNGGGAGQTVKLVPAELLDEAGRPNQKPVGRPVSFSYTTRGGGSQHWTPRFSYYGFRYVQAIGENVDEVHAHFAHAALQHVGTFRCSDPLLNRIHELINAAMLSNAQSVLTDCPHREKLGWLEQSHLMGPAMFANYDAKPYYEKISADMRDAQHADGCVPTIAPQYTVFQKPWDIYNDSPEWGAACVLNPWLIYTRSGDARVLATNYESMNRFLDYLTRRAENHLITYGLGDWYDVGPGDPGMSKLTTLGLTATATYFQCATTLAKAAGVLGRQSDVQRLQKLSGEICNAFNQRFLNRDKRQYDTNSQTANAMPLALEMVPDEVRPAVLDHLIADIRNNGNRVTAGDVGFRYVIDALGSAGRSDVIYDLVTYRDGPGYAMQLERGATTLTEAWDANVRSSQNHLMLGHAEIWFHQYLAGIDVDLSREPDRQIIIQPGFAANVDWVEASYDSALGRIEVRWDKSSAGHCLSVLVPPNTTATVMTQTVASGRHMLSNFQVRRKFD